MNKPLRVLQVVTVMNQGGAETMVMNHYRVIDRSRVQFDFLVCREERGFYDDEVEALGGRIFRTVPIRPWSYRHFFKWIDAFFAEHASEYVAVHSHIQENSGFVFKYAQKHGIRNCIAHSHIAFRGIDAKIPFRKFAHYFQLKYSTYNLSCGTDAGKYLFGHRHYELFNNAIDSKKYLANESVRNRIREELNINDRIVIGSVARITWQKNHTFMLDVMSEMVHLCPQALLLLIGSGDKEQEIKQKICSLHLEKHVMMLGARPNIHELLQAFDVFFMPSLFEGLPVSVIEAQAAGLQCILSDSIDATTDVTGNVHFVSLKESVDVWCEKILSVCHLPHQNTFDKIANAGYDVNQNVSRLLKLYGVAHNLDPRVMETKSPKVTIGLPVWNAEKTVFGTIHSILNQTFSDFELIISDDGSVDYSLDVIRSFDDPRIRIIEGNENRGIAYRLNEQIRQARGKFFVRMDADDLMMPKRLEHQVQVMENTPDLDVLGTAAVVMDDMHQVLGLRYSGNKDVACGSASYLLHPTIMARTSWFRMHFYNPDYSGWEDYELWMRTKRFSKFAALSEPLIFYKDSLKFDVKKFINRRFVGNRVIFKEWMFFDSPVVAVSLLLSNLCSCVVVPIVHALGLDEWKTRKRNVPLSGADKLKYQRLLTELLDIQKC